MRRSLVLAFMLVLSAGAAPAQQVPGLCGERQEMQTRFAQNLGQRPAGTTVIGSGLTVELLTSPSGGWSVLLSFPDGRTCLVDQAGPGDRQPPAPFVRKR